MLHRFFISLTILIGRIGLGFTSKFSTAVTTAGTTSRGTRRGMQVGWPHSPGLRLAWLGTLGCTLLAEMLAIVTRITAVDVYRLTRCKGAA